MRDSDYHADKTSLDRDYGDRAVFSTYDDDYGLVAEPRPSSDYLPEWASEDCTDPGVMDALREGWILRTPASVEANSNRSATEDSDTDVIWRTAFDKAVISLHTKRQMRGLPIPFEITKFHSYWTLHLPEGYSALLTKPVNRYNPIFTPFSGCVDFDKFPTMTHAPSMFEKETKVQIPEGTPIAQVIPFKREDLLTTASVREATEDELDELDEPYERAEKTETSIEYEDV